MQKLIAAAAMSALALASHSGSAYMNENTFAEQPKTEVPPQPDQTAFNNDYYGYNDSQTVNTDPEGDLYGAWPPVNKFTTFKADVTLEQWNGKQLIPFKGISGTAKVDGDRSKIMVDAYATLPVVGKVPAKIVIDTKAGYAIESIPTLNICQKRALPVKIDLKVLLNKIYSETGGITTYDGLIQPVWDSKAYNAFHSSVKGSQGQVTIHSYIDATTHNGRWLQEESSAKQDPKVIVNIPNGEVPTTFNDADFVISGCSPSAYSIEEELISIW